jgi:RNA polymerase sigma-70 factor, ECF subfamily
MIGRRHLFAAAQSGAATEASRNARARYVPSRHDDFLLVIPEPTPSRYRQLRRFVRRRVSSSEAAEDVTQEVFASMAQVLARSEASAPESLGWLYAVARRRIIDEARRTRAETVSLEVVPDPEAGDGNYGSLVASTLSAALERLSEGQRSVLVLRLLRGESFSAIAKQVGITEEACRMRFMRGLEQLRDEFEKEGLTP